MSKGIYIGMASALFLAVIGAITLFNTWQIANLEERLIETHQAVAGLKNDLGSINNRLARMSQGGFVAGGGGGGGNAQAAACDGNLLGAPNDLLPEEAEFGGTLTRSVIAGSKGYNVITENGADVQEIFTYVGGALGERNLDDPNIWAPSLAWCIQVNDDRTRYTVKLRNDVYWHPIQPQYLERSSWLDGEQQLTVDDFIFAMEMIMDPAVEGAAPLRTYYQDYDGIEKINDHEMVVKWKKKTFQSLSFTMGLIPMAKWIYSKDPDGTEYPKEAMGQNFNSHWYRHMMGTGPYLFDSFEENNYVKLVKNPNYFGLPPAFDEIVYRVVGNPDQRLAQLQAGDLDFINLEPAQFKQQVVNPGADSDFTNEFTDEGAPDGGTYGYEIYPRMAYRYIGWNADGPFFGDKRVRRAMTHALNREVLIKEIWMNLGQLVTGNFYPESPEYDDSIEPWSYDLDKASALLDEAGWVDSNGNGVRDKDGQEFQYTMLVYGYRPEFISMAEYYKEDLKKIGVDLTISPVDWPTMQTKMNAKEFDAYTGGWALSWESDPYQIWHSSQADVPEGSNRVGFRNERADEIIEEARVTFDPKRRVELFHEFHKIVHEEQPYTFFFADKGVGAWQPQMRNMEFQKVRPHDLALPWYKELQ